MNRKDRTEIYYITLNKYIAINYRRIAEWVMKLLIGYNYTIWS